MLKLFYIKERDCLTISKTALHFQHCGCLLWFS